jgi:signal transduction histidine kinase
MRASGEVAGALCAAWRDGPAFQRNDPAQLMQIANQLAFVVLHHRLQQEEQAAQSMLEGLAARDSILRPLQDHLLQSLYAIGLQLQGARSDSDSPVLQKALHDLNAAIRDVRALLMQSEQEPSTFLAAGGLKGCIEALVGTGSRSPEWRVEFRLGDRALDATTQVELYLITRELVANVYAHAGAQNAAIAVRRRGASVILAVQDDGVGFDREGVLSPSVGLESVSRRATALGGHATIESAPGCGTKVTVQISLRSAGRVRALGHGSTRR